MHIALTNFRRPPLSVIFFLLFPLSVLEGATGTIPARPDTVARLRSPRDDRATETPPLCLTGSCSAHASGGGAGAGADPGVGGKKREEPRPQPPPTYRPTAADRTRNLVRGGRRGASRIAVAFGGPAAVDRLGKMTAQPFSNSFLDRPRRPPRSPESSAFLSVLCGREGGGIGEQECEYVRARPE